MAEKKPFQSIAPAETRRPNLREVQTFAAERGAPLLSNSRGAPSSIPAQRAPVARLNLEIPAYLKPQLKKRAFEEDVSILFLVLDALSKAGYRVDEADLVGDKRRA